MKIEDVKLIKFDNMENLLGKQVELNRGGKIPFKIHRIFYSYATEEKMVRGAHANRKSEFVLISAFGSLKVRVYDGSEEKIYCLEDPTVGLYIPRMIWKEMYDFSKDNVLLVISSEHYDSEEYIRDYDEYVGIKNGAK